MELLVWTIAGGLIPLGDHSGVGGARVQSRGPAVAVGDRAGAGSAGNVRVRGCQEQRGGEGVAGACPMSVRVSHVCSRVTCLFACIMSVRVRGRQEQRGGEGVAGACAHSPAWCTLKFAICNVLVLSCRYGISSVGVEEGLDNYLGTTVCHYPHTVASHLSHSHPTVA
jgi:hypothetical protein